DAASTFESPLASGEPAIDPPAIDPPAFDPPAFDPPAANVDVPLGAGTNAEMLTAPSESGGERLNRPENVDEVLQTLRDNGLFHPMDDAPVEWSSAKEGAGEKQRVGRALIGVWVLAMLLAGGGYFGYSYWVGTQKAEATARVESARAEALRGDHADLVDAERILRQARELDPSETEGPGVLLFALVQRVLEGGDFQAGFLRPALQRAKGLPEERQTEALQGLIAGSDAVLAFAQGDSAAGTTALTTLRENASDPRVLYMLGRLEQRLGAEEAESHLAASVEDEPQLVAAQLALAELEADSGRPAEAKTRLERVLEAEPEHLRARLWLQYLGASDGEPGPLLEAHRPLESRLDVGSPTDQVLFRLTEARLLRRSGAEGASASAAAAVESAATAGATEPRLLALVARAAQALGDLGRAQRAARTAAEGAPGVPEYRKLLAEILVERRDGARALRVLELLPADDPEVQVLKAEAALASEDPVAVAAAVQALGESLDDESPVRLKALLLRLRVVAGDARSALRDARRLARANPGDADVGLALGEAALGARDGRRAVDALQSVTQAAPDNPDGFIALGRAHRMLGDGEAAEEAIRSALEIRPAYGPAEQLLGYVLLDRGKFAEADALYQSMIDAGRQSTSARLGRIEALLGLMRSSDAQVQFESLPDAAKESASGRIVGARIALLSGQASEAVTALRPLVEQEEVSTDTLALYGEALTAAGAQRAASEVFDRALDQDDFHPEALIGMAQVLFRGEKYRDALSLLDDARRALERRVRAPSVRARMMLVRGRIHLERDDGADAREVLREAAELPGAPAEVHFYLGEALSSHNTPQATVAYQRYLELAPEGALARRARRAIER
ncbi:MAG: tetratricopeptide repeat protein, partial [Myxococcota bacterium]